MNVEKDQSNEGRGTARRCCSNEWLFGKLFFQNHLMGDLRIARHRDRRQNDRHNLLRRCQMVSTGLDLVIGWDFFTRRHHHSLFTCAGTDYHGGHAFIGHKPCRNHRLGEDGQSHYQQQKAGQNPVMAEISGPHDKPLIIPPVCAGKGGGWKIGKAFIY